MFVLSDVNILWISARFWLQVGSPSRLRSDFEQNSMFSSYLVLLIYVKEMLYLPGILPFFKIHVNQCLAPDDSPAANVTSRHVVGEGPGAIP